MALKSKKGSYIFSNDTFHLTRWNGVVRLNGTPSLTYRSQHHLSEVAKAELVSFFHFFHFQVFPLIFHFDLFLGL